MAKVGLAFNLIKPDQVQELPLDCIAELDSKETIQAVADALVTGGHEVVFLEASENFADKLRASRPEIVFNIAEGLQGDCRETRVPAICESFGIPYTGSGIPALSLCLNKARANEALSANQIMVPPYQEFFTRDDVLRLNTEFPLIVKLLYEGSSMGLSKKSVVINEVALRNQVEFIISNYHETALVQKYILGRELTVGILGNQHPFVLPITEITFQDPYGIVTLSPNDDVLLIIKQACGEQFFTDFNDGLIPHQSNCPARISPELAERINQTALKAFKALGCRDWCRVDFRLGTDNQLYVLELNPIADIAPGDWFPNSAKAVHLNYDALINRILDIALERVDGNQRT